MAANTTTTSPPQETQTFPPQAIPPQYDNTLPAQEPNTLPAQENNASPPQEMPSSNPPDYASTQQTPQPTGDQGITAVGTTTTETPAPVDEKRELQQPQPALVQPMQGDGKPTATQPGPRNLLDNPVAVESLRQDPGPITCPHCRNRAMTRTDLESGNTVTAWAVAICCILGVCCAWIPCVMDSCKDTVHTCSKCQNRVVTITNSGTVKLHTQGIVRAPAPTPKGRAG